MRRAQCVSEYTFKVSLVHVCFVELTRKSLTRPRRKKKQATGGKTIFAAIEAPVTRTRVNGNEIRTKLANLQTKMKCTSFHNRVSHKVQISTTLFPRGHAKRSVEKDLQTENHPTHTPQFSRLKRGLFWNRHHPKMHGNCLRSEFTG